MVRRVVILGVAAAFFLPASALAATTNISVINDQFVNGTRTVAIGDTVEWTNNGSPSRTHTTSGLQPLRLWNETLSAGETYPLLFEQAGAFAYRCNIHTNMTGKIKVPVKINPASGDLDTVFTVRLGNIGANADFEYVVQRMKNNGQWKNWRTTENATVNFDPSSPGTYSFRSKIRRISDGASTGFSPKRSITVSS